LEKGVIMWVCFFDKLSMDQIPFQTRFSRFFSKPEKIKKYHFPEIYFEK